MWTNPKGLGGESSGILKEGIFFVEGPKRNTVGGTVGFERENSSGGEGRFFKKLNDIQAGLFEERKAVNKPGY